MPCEIVGVGHCCYDYLCTVENYPPEDGSTHILKIENQGGGAVGTAMTAAKRLGASCGVIANWGDDETGRMIRNDFLAEGIDISTAETVPGVRSPVSYVMVNPAGGTRTKFPAVDVLPPVRWTEQQKKMLREASVLHLDGTNYANAVRAAELAHEYGVPVSLDGCRIQPENEKNRALASMADILIMNARYPYRVAETDSLEEALRYFTSLGPGTVISTSGANGCAALIDGQFRRFSSFQVNTVDSTGAGDVFHGAFLTAWLTGMDTADCIRFASAASALKCEHMGGRAGIPNRETVLAFLASHQ